MAAPALGDRYLIDCHDTEGNRVTAACEVREVLKMNSGGYRLGFDRPGPHLPGGLNSVALRTDSEGNVILAAHWPADTQTRRLEES